MIVTHQLKARNTPGALVDVAVLQTSSADSRGVHDGEQLCGVGAKQLVEERHIVGLLRMRGCVSAEWCIGPMSYGDLS